MPKVRQLGARIPADLHEQLEVVATVDNTSMNALITEAIELLICRRRSDPEWLARRDQLLARLSDL